MTTKDIAIICHEANRALCFAHSDSTQKPWEEAEQWQRDSAIKGVRFAIDNPDATPEAQHEAWCRDKRADGWAYGPVKDPSKKEHPCLVPYIGLPAFQQAKDHLFRGIVGALKGFIE